MQKPLALAAILLFASSAVVANVANAEPRVDMRGPHHDHDRDQTAQPAGAAAKPEQAAAEHSYETRTQAHIRELVHANRHAVTQEERTLVDNHWRLTARIWRIRHLAENAGDKATVSRCDTLLARADQILDRQLKKFAEKAPMQGGGAR